MNTLTFFDMFVLCILAFIILGILSGQGDRVMSILNGKNRKSPYDPQKEVKAVFWYAIVLLAAEVLMMFSDALGRWVILVALAIAIIGGMVVAYYLKKYAIKKD
ncbi:MAG: hypothetical protein KBS83_01740 [Lachnospiraceae bacterium]|nr:hypothetical protein [Candidatus Equihabitans merdae]